MEIFTEEGAVLLLRWVHFLAGITWIGLLYYFNFVQVPFFAEIEPEVRTTAVRRLVPRALWWFRWSALVTWLAGVGILIIRVARSGFDVLGSPYGVVIMTGAGLGTLMLLNVWGVIWPQQKIVIASAEAAATGGTADPRAADAGRRALLASRTNVVFSIPMLFFMGTAGHFSGAFNQGGAGEKVLYLVVAAVATLALEANALTGLTGPTKRPLETIGNVIATGFVLFLVLYLVLEATLGT